MLWLKENRDNIKQMYFSNYTLKTNEDGKKENFQSVLIKKAGEIWNSLDSDSKEVYNIKLKKLKESLNYKTELEFNSENEELEGSQVQDEDSIGKKKVYCPNKCGAIRKTLEGLYSHLGLKENAADNCPKKPHIIKTRAYKKALEKLYSEPNTTIDFSQYLKDTTYSVDDYPSPPDNWNGPFQSKYLSKNAKGADGKPLSFIRFDEAVQVARKIETCGGITKTSHGYSLRVGSNLMSTSDGDPTGLASWIKTKEPPPPYEVKPDVQAKRKSIPKAVKNSVWNKYIETDDPKKLIGKCFVGCGCEITIANFEVGHVNAYSKGGSDKVENLRPICSTCNKSMGTMNLLEFKDLYGLDSKKEVVLTEEELKHKIQELDDNISSITNENDTYDKKQINEQFELEKCNLERSNINDNITNDWPKIHTKREDINEQIVKLKLQIDDLQASLKEDISLINISIKENTIKLKDTNKQYLEHKDNISSIKEKIDLNINSIEYFNTEKQKYEEKLEAINKQKEEAHNIMIQQIEKEVKEEIQKEYLRKQIKERLLQEQQTKQGDLINLSSPQ
jgi:hypothetical protein